MTITDPPNPGNPAGFQPADSSPSEDEEKASAPLGVSQPANEDKTDPQSTASPNGKFSVFSGLQTVLTYAFLLATLFTFFSPDNLFSGHMIYRLFEAWQANPTYIAPVKTMAVNENTKRIGNVSGH
jgi:hypothetical protein